MTNFYEAQARLFHERLAEDIARGTPGTPQLIAERTMEMAEYTVGTPQRQQYMQHFKQLQESPAMGGALTDLSVQQAGLPFLPIIGGLASKLAGSIWGTLGVNAWIWSSVLTKGGDEGVVYAGIGGDGMTNGAMIPQIGGVPILSNGVPEPPPSMVVHEWVQLLRAKKWKGEGESFYMYFWRLIDGRIMSYHPYKGFKIWRPKKPIAVLFRGGRLDLKTAVRAQKYLDGVWKTVAKKTKQLKMAK